MAPNRFEKDIKKKFEDRTITPSTDAWDSLSKQLDSVTSQKPGRNYLRYGVAAGFIGIMFVSVMYFNTEIPSSIPDKQVVDTDEGKVETKNILNEKSENHAIETVVENGIKEKIFVDGARSEANDHIPEPRDQVAVVEEMESRHDTANESIGLGNKLAEELIDTKVLAIVATVDSLERNNQELTDAEVDELLRNAQEEILRYKLFDQNGSVDAMALLTEVEDELDRSFRDQIFESLKEGFFKVRTAVADRNK